MSIFGDIMGKIFHAATSAVEGAVLPASADAAPAGQAASPASPSAAAAAAASPSSPGSTQSVDIGSVLTQMASQKGGGGNWQTSIVDLLKLLDLDSSLNARKQLANELNTHAGADGTAEENVALHKAVMQKLAENGGKVPASMVN